MWLVSESDKLWLNRLFDFNLLELVDEWFPLRYSWWSIEPLSHLFNDIFNEMFLNYKYRYE